MLSSNEQLRTRRFHHRSVVATNGARSDSQRNRKQSVTQAYCRCHGIPIPLARSWTVLSIAREGEDPQDGDGENHLLPHHAPPSNGHSMGDEALGPWPSGCWKNSPVQKPDRVHSAWFIVAQTGEKSKQKSPADVCGTGSPGIGSVNTHVRSRRDSHSGVAKKELGEGGLELRCVPQSHRTAAGLASEVRSWRRHPAMV